MGDVFISYKSEDRELVAPLARALEQAGLSVWWDKKIAAGGTWRETIAGALESAKVVVVAWSKRTEDSAAAAWVFNEVDEAQRVRKPIVPVQLEDCVIPLGYRHLQAANLIGWRGDPANAEFQEVLEGVRAGIAGRRVGAAASAPGSAAARAQAETSSTPAKRFPVWLLGPVVALAALGAAWFLFPGLFGGSVSSSPDMDVAETTEGYSDPAAFADEPVIDEAVTRPIEVYYTEADQTVVGSFARYEGDIWHEYDANGEHTYTWVRMSGDAPVMELLDEPRAMRLQFDFERGVILIEMNGEPFSDWMYIGNVTSEPIE